MPVKYNGNEVFYDESVHIQSCMYVYERPGKIKKVLINTLKIFSLLIVKVDKR